MSADVHIYTTDYCPYCTQAKRLLSRKKVSFTEINVEERPDLRQWLISASGQKTVPQVFINGQPVGGYTDISALEHEGKLDVLLAEHPSPGTPQLPR